MVERTHLTATNCAGVKSAVAFFCLVTLCAILLAFYEPLHVGLAVEKPYSSAERDHLKLGIFENYQPPISRRADEEYVCDKVHYIDITDTVETATNMAKKNPCRNGACW
jgi:hypothetical protein